MPDRAAWASSKLAYDHAHRMDGSLYRPYWENDLWFGRREPCDCSMRAVTAVRLKCD